MLAALLAFTAFAAVVTVTPGLDTMLVVRTAALLTRPAVRRRLDQLTGLVFIGFAVRLALGGTVHRAVA